MEKSLIYFFLIALTACGPGNTNSANVFFGGEIVNPADEYVTLFKGDQAIDSAKLDKENRFSIRLDSISEGLHHFNHGNELQYVYLEGGDSLIIRLNTMYFDESLVFSGQGEEINNFLLERFLRHEDENEIIRTLYRREAEEFEKAIDSLNAVGLAELDDLKAEGNISENEEKIAKASISYHYDTYKEEYPFKHKKSTKHHETVAQPPSDFYDYRKNLTYNDTDLTYLRPYYNFMINHVGNLSYMTCAEKCGIKNGTAHNQLHFNHHKLNIIDSLVVEKELKDNLYRYVAIDYLVNVHDSEENNEKFIESFHELSNNNRHMDEINKLYKGILNLQPNRKIPDVKVSNMEGEMISLQDIAQDKDHKTVFYFWSGTDRRHFENMNQRVSRLAAERPEYSFVGINVKTEENNWKALVQNSGLDTTLQFRSTDFEALTEALIVYPLNKCIITNDNGTIVDAFANVYESL